MSEGSPLERVRRLVTAARRLADRGDPLGREARAALPSVTGLSPEGVELALAECLEVDPTERELAALVASVTPAPRVSVLLSANVFVAAHRAIALALAASGRVSVRASRREPVTARLLAAAAPGLFDLVERLSPEPGDTVFAYGADATLDAVRASLPAGVALVPHGTGLGVVALGLAGADGARIEAVATAVASDVVLFDQRGCLSPRVVAVVASETETRAFASALARALADAERRVPTGTLTADERADATRYRDTARFAGELLTAGAGAVGVDVSDGAPLLVPPAGRHVHVVRAPDPARALAPLGRAVAALGLDLEPELHAAMRTVFPRARTSPPGRMQRPPFDGPVDRRGDGRVNRGGAPLVRPAQ